MTYTLSFLSLTTYRDFVLKFLVFLLFILSAFMSGVGEAKAITFDLTFPATDYWDDPDTASPEIVEIDKNDNGIIEVSYDYTVAYFTVNTDKTTYTAGETINLSATVFGEVCQNFDPHTTVSATLNANSTSLVSDALAGFQQTWIYGVGTLTAPITPGEYTILVDACYTNIDATLSGCRQEPITITVVSGTPVPPVAGAPIGVLGTANCWVLSGWTCDPSDYGKQLWVEFYDQNSTYLGETRANIDYDESAIAAQCGGTDWHRFTSDIPEYDLTDGVTRTITAYAVGVGGGPSPQQLGGAFTLTCDPYVDPDLYALMQTPVEGGVYKVGNQISFDVTAVNTAANSIQQGGWAGIEIDINSDNYRDSDEPWYDNYDTYVAVPNDTTPLGIFAPSQSKQFSVPVSDLPVGDHQVRFDVDVTDVVSESDGYNNYSWNPAIPGTTWRTIHVINGDLTVNPNSIALGESGTVTWTTENTEDLDCSVVTDTGVVIGTGANGTNVSTGTLSDDTTYILSCESIILVDPIVVDVVGTVGLPDISVSDILVNPNQPADLTWDTNNGDETLCTLTGGTLPGDVLATDGGNVNTGSEQITITARTTYTLSCPSGSDTVTVEVVPKAYET